MVIALFIIDVLLIGLIVYMFRHLRRDIIEYQAKVINQEREISDLEKENEILEFKLESRE